MPIRHPAGNPPFNIIRMSHIELGVTNLEASRKFYTEILGLIETEQVGNSIYLRCLEERNHHSFVLTETADPYVYRFGFKAASEADLDKIETHFQNKGLPTCWVDQHGQGRTLQTRDIFGMPLEFCYEFTQVERNLQKYSTYHGCHPQRIDHFNCFTPDVQASHDFWALDLGFRTTEYTKTEDGDQLWAVWMHRKGNVHDMAFTNGRGPRMHHVAIWVPTALHIIHLCDIMATTGHLASMERGPGRHGISNAFFLYVRDPDGHRVEIYTSDYLTVDPDFVPVEWNLHDPQRQTLWGHPAPRSWFEEGSPLVGTEMQEPALQAQPIVAP
ncbi:MAG: 3,4-dihydroxyphenylacetate 2,3-dioxygenase [Ardenticatenaceae bacterium]|nr:3,4-dihydroxyphenylacetate 2,3-dioxygenase [Ardenticatenaceae bacterium]